MASRGTMQRVLVVASILLVLVAVCNATSTETLRKHHHRARAAARAGVHAGIRVAGVRFGSAKLLANPLVQQFFSQNPVSTNKDAAGQNQGIEIKFHSLKFPNGTKDWVYKMTSKDGMNLDTKFDRPYLEAVFQDAYASAAESVDARIPSTVGVFNAGPGTYTFPPAGTLLVMVNGKEKTISTKSTIQLKWPKGLMPMSAGVSIGLNNDARFLVDGRSYDTPTDEGVLAVWNGARIKAAEMIGENKTVRLRMHFMKNEPPYVDLVYSAKFF